jgi:hypothetical protein
MANPTSNFNWQMPTPTDLVTDLPADFEVFGQAVDTSLADLLGGTSGQVLSKNSNTDMDFVWVTTGTFPKLSFVTPSSNFTSSSTSFVDVTDYTITITPVSGTNTIQLTANLSVQLGTTSNTDFRILVDGVALGVRLEAPLEATVGTITVIGYVSNLAATAKVCKLQMKAAGGVSTTVYGSSSGYTSNFGVLEIY